MVLKVLNTLYTVETACIAILQQTGKQKILIKDTGNVITC